MRRYSEILRFQDGVRVQATAPEATAELPPVGMSLDAGEQLFVLVDLGPGQAHRSRETRTLAARVYWQSPGGIVARLRRALAEANRYVLQENLRAPQPQSASGNITCAVFAGEELFLGQVGPGNVLLYHAGGEVEIFPSSALPMLPLGAGLPPAIHIGYAPVAPGCALLIATASVAETQARSLWAETLAVAEPEQSVEQVLRLMHENRVTGCAVVVHCLPEPATHSEAYLLQKPPSKPEPSRAAELTSGAAETVRTEEPAPAVVLAAEPLRPRQEAAATVLAFTEPLVPPPPAPEPAPRRPALPGRKSTSGPNVSALPAVAPTPATPAEPLAPIPPTPPPSSAMETGEETKREAPAARPRLSLPRLKLPSLHLRETLGPLFRAFGRALMPGKVKAKRARVSRMAPQENPLLLSSLALGLLLLTSLITLTTYFQFGGASRVETLLADAEVAWQEAYTSQAAEDWQRALTLAQQVLTLDSSNARAQTLRDEAQLNLEMLEKAAVLSLTKIAELGVSPAPRRLLVTRTWIYLLNPVTEEVLGMPLAEDGLRLSSAAPTSILRRGQIVAGATVEHLVDIAWVTPGATYGDGALFIYSDDGTLYVYEPTLGPGGITRQRLEGEHTSRSVTMIATYGEQLYLLDRQQGQLFRYAPLNRLYNSPPRPYFVPGAAPQLQTVLNLGLDGRLYLLLGDGSVRVYFSGAEDLTFALRGLPDNNLQAAVMYVEPDAVARDPHEEPADEGRIYLGDRQNERIVALDKRGNYLHQFRVREGQLRQLETFVVTQEPRVLYMIAANGLYAALLPEFSSP